MIDIAADEGWLSTVLRIMHLVQMCVQGRWISDSSCLILPHFKNSHLPLLNQEVNRSHLAKFLSVREFSCLPHLLTLYQQDEKFMSSVISKVIGSPHQAKEVCSTVLSNVRCQFV